MPQGYLIGETLLGQVKDVVKRVHGEPLGGPATRIETRFEEIAQPQKNNNIILVKNSGTPVPWLGVISIFSPINNPSGTTLVGTAPEGRSFASQPVMSGNVPGDPNAMCGIAMEPIAANAVGRVAVSGVIPCKMKILSQNHGYARARVGDSTQLVSCECGPYRILWKDSPGNDKFALVTA